MTSSEVIPRPLPTTRERPFDPPSELFGLPPVSPMLFAGGGVGWIVTGYAAARAVLADQRFSADRSLAESPIQAVPNRFRKAGLPPGMFNMMDPPEHTRYRKMLTGQFTVRRMKRLEPRIEEITDAALDAMAQLTPPVDLVEEFSLPVPLLVICELLGIPFGYRAEFKRYTAVLVNVHSSVHDLMTTVDELRTFMRELIQARRATPDDALIAGLIAATDLTDDELIGMSQVLLLAGHETSANMLALGTFALLQHPDQWERLLAEPELMPGAVEELLRYLSVAHLGPVRAALADADVGGVTIRKGETVMISVPVANRDPGLVTNGDVLDVTRPRTHHLAFGHGVHQCIGQQLSRLEMVIGFRKLLERFPDLRLSVDPGDVRMRTDMRVYGVHELPVTWG